MSLTTQLSSRALLPSFTAGLKPKDAAGLVAMQNKEINNGRLAMIGVAGMVGQELVTQHGIFGA